MTALAKLGQALVGWKGYAMAALAGALIAGGAAWTTQGWRKDVQIAELQRDQQQVRADTNAAVLDAVRGDIGAIAAAAARAAADARTLPAHVGEITKALKNAKPLIAGCRPDDLRVRNLTDAVRAARGAAAGYQPGGAVPAYTGSAAKP
ncbi:hypothetical protein RAS12_13225 [Achromobacter seleniivolatilans]|uniref:Phage protein n=1 Tax=Achromobacter seleniivolatilans TaxID=3047478 RepID=A0ABY9M8C6_9BURK|nr:hypothetical protein [Achromobacter sp. R39]WMD23286.1 hypothetical protein RAS12_13225 [Achromobacter sp. R39]